MSPQFAITYEPQPIDLSISNTWRKHDVETYLEETIEGKIGLFYNSRPILETIIFNDLPKHQWIITNTPTLPGYQIAQWLIDVSWQLFYKTKPEHTSLEEIVDWDLTNSLDGLSNGTNWPRVTIWRNDDDNDSSINLHVQPFYTFREKNSYNYMGYNRQPHTILTIDKEQFIDQRNVLITKVLNQCVDRGFRENELLNMYNEVLDA